MKLRKRRENVTAKRSHTQTRGKKCKCSGDGDEKVKFAPDTKLKLDIFHHPPLHTDPPFFPFPGNILSVDVEKSKEIEDKLHKHITSSRQKGRLIGWQLGYDPTKRIFIGYTAETLQMNDYDKSYFGQEIIRISLKLKFLQRFTYKPTANTSLAICQGGSHQETVCIVEDDFHHAQLSQQCSSLPIPSAYEVFQVVESVLFEKARNLCAQHVVFGDEMKYADDFTAFSYWLGSQLPFHWDERNLFLRSRCNAARLSICIGVIERFITMTLDCRKCGLAQAHFKDRFQSASAILQIISRTMHCNRFYHYVNGMQLIPIIQVLECPVTQHGREIYCRKCGGYLGYKCFALDVKETNHSFPAEFFYLRLDRLKD